MSLHVVILAAGKGSRMKSALPKVLHPLAGKPLLQHVLDTAQSLEAEAVHIVIGNGADQVKEAVHDANIHWALQAEQLGTGHAVAQALPNIPDDATLLVLYGDVPLISQPSLQRLLDLVEADTLALLSVDLPDATGYGRIVRDVAGDVRAIVEHKDATPEQLEITEANTGILAGPAKLMKALLPKVENKNAQSEYYLTDLIELAVSEGFEVEAEQADNLEEVQGPARLQPPCRLAEVHQREPSGHREVVEVLAPEELRARVDGRPPRTVALRQRRYRRQPPVALQRAETARLCAMAASGRRPSSALPPLLPGC